ncbi:Phosphoinositide phosphatase sac1 [Basidiobolus ranarum]|uniref:Phosphoinositide phosphatase sac1 n=1 Tax=Basidiobolus ranarum TaxID=34480 RepID=A0ABR2WW52_9FUNG
MSLHQNLVLYVKNSSFVLKPTTVLNGSTKALIINRDTGDLSLEEPSNEEPAKEILNVYGIFGTIPLISSNYLIVITGRAPVGKIHSHDIYRVTETRLFPYSRSTNTLSEAQKSDESTYLSLLNSSLNTSVHYFSYTYDLTQSLERQSEFVEANQQALWQRADDRFYWNHYLQKHLIESAQQNLELGQFILPVMHGFVEVRPAIIKDKAFTFALISRRSKYRVGTRYFSRGVDEEGNVSNFVETEQIIISGAHQLSYVQTRGSIPVYWSQVTNMKYTPKLSIHYADKTAEAFKKHFDKQIELYGDQIVVNLINKKGYETPMGIAFEDRINELHNPHVKYVHFDFHHECRNMRWDRISVLVDQISSDLDRQGYYHSLSSEGQKLEILKKQSSVTRTNCMDCLDRTNVVQSVLARKALTLQLREIAVLGPQEQCDQFPDFEFLLRNVWADNADAISIAYSGTGALKTDFTRTGQRTKAGAFKDFVNSTVRYFKNNYSDGSRQDAYDLLLGKYTIDPSKPSPFTNYRIIRFKMACGVLSLLVITMCAGHFTMSSPGESTILSKIFWLGLFVGCGYMLSHELPAFIDRPKLCPLPSDIFGHPYGPLFNDSKTLVNSNTQIDLEKKL